MKALSLLGFAVMVVGMIGLWRVGALFGNNPLLIALQVAAGGLMIWARITFGLRSFHASANPTSGGLVVHGPYRVIRHPIYTAICLFVVAGVLGHLSVISVLFALLVGAGALARMLSEERLLIRRYQEYSTYSARTKRMIPWVF
jgi:protein-S-isoprenylcysteine O-methyltransferase Ste14